MEWGYAIAGLAVGFIVGLTGVGGGSLMTPILLWFGISPATAVGTDLLYAALTKMGGVAVHHRQGHVDWRVAGWLSAGSVPAALLVLAGLSYLHLPEKMLDTLFKLVLGVALLLTAAAILGKPLLLRWLNRGGAVSLPSEPRIGLTIATGVALGALVTLSSIGAGALGTLALFLLYPALSTSRLVGTEIAHAVPLTLVAGLGHAGLGNVDVMLLANLLLGSLPGIWLGSKLTRRLAERWLRPTLALMLGLIGAKLVF
ncbi:MULTISPECIES: sulfite exporter TauE/SafE family protein [Chromobacterium]|uniref:Probable membrane transporter protein n=1 Tax=Chromobacterium aquaticum TaxID=467180 RepID=A0ABV8ZT23_9NEIS|nr:MULTISPECIES: sulfite exporter TauE/SafE family protein [Chromobacterium]KMN35486.1 membrane protein [Chromobacterium sp. LK1]MCD5363263.1 sulfite exporter TauE/SafE family protein [Chromobacterium aquaticum]